MLRTTNFTADGRLSYDDLTFRAIDTEKKKDKILKPGDIIIEKSGGTPKKPVGRCVYFDRDDDYDYDYFCSNFTAVLRANPETVNTKYLWYILQEHYKTRQCLKYQYKTNGIANLDITDYLSHIEVDLPSRDLQDKRVEAMDYSQHLLDIHQELLDIIDKAVKSRFVEMFGDPIANPYGIPVVKLSELSSLITKGASPKWQGFTYSDDTTQTLFVTSENVREGFLDLSEPKYVEDNFNDKQKRSMLQKGDLLINIVGASIGRAAKFDSEQKANINQAVALVRTYDDAINLDYLLRYLNSEKALQMYDSMKSDVARANLSLQDIGNLDILVPQRADQNRYADFVTLADKSKLIIQKSLENLTELRESLMQEYFG